MKIQIQLIKPQFKFEKGLNTAKIDPPKVANWLGAAYFRIQGNHGQLEARLGGMVMKMDKLGFDWRIVALPSDRTPLEKPDTQPSNDKEMELTPIEMGSKEKPKSGENLKDKTENPKAVDDKAVENSKETPKKGKNKKTNNLY
jgi:hypothetical protein